MKFNLFSDKIILGIFPIIIGYLLVRCTKQPVQSFEENEIQYNEKGYLIEKIDFEEYESNKPTMKIIDKFPNLEGVTWIHNDPGCFGASKGYQTKDGLNFYYQWEGDSYLILPFNMGELQTGTYTKDVIWVDDKDWTGKYINKFLNKDKNVHITLIYNDYDAWLNKYDNYQDTLRLNYLKTLDLKDDKLLIDKSNIILVEGKRKSKDLKQEHYFISKWILKKGIGGKNCEMILYIDYLDDISEMQKKELLTVAKKFPNNPF